MWQADGYYDPPTGFTKISERESRLANALLGIKMPEETKPPRTCCRTHWEEDTQRYAVGKDGVLWNPWGMPFMMCKVCGCKRCPKATDCSLECIGSNEPGQLGSIYGTPLPPKETK